MIDRFVGKYFFLSNFSPHPAEWKLIKYPTAEHAFQAAKSLEADQRTKILYADTPARAKALGRQVKLQPYWDEYYRYEAMRQILQSKFSDKELREKLVETSGHILIEGNNWGDQTWGVTSQGGHNLLGWMLMRLREQFIYEGGTW